MSGGLSSVSYTLDSMIQTESGQWRVQCLCQGGELRCGVCPWKGQGCHRDKCQREPSSDTPHLVSGVGFFFALKSWIYC